MYLDEADKQKLEALLSKSKKKYSPAALERPEETFAIAIGAKQPASPKAPSQVGTDFFSPGLAAKSGHSPADFPIVAELDQTWEEKLEDQSGGCRPNWFLSWNNITL